LAIPITHWLPGFRRGVTFLLLAMLAAIPSVQWRFHYLYIYSLRINPEALLATTYALIFFPAVWFMTRRADFLPHNPLRYRKWLLGLTIAQLVFALCAFWFSQTIWPLSYYWASILLMLAYGLMPMIYVAEFWLLLELLYKILPLLRYPLPRLGFRLVQWPLI